MSISQKLENNYKNQMEKIKNEKNIESKIKQIGSLILDLGKRSINAVAKACKCCWRFANKCYELTHNSTTFFSNKIKCGRKKYEDKYPKIVKQIKAICENTEHVDASLKDNITYIDVTANYILEQLAQKYNYS